MWLSRKSSPFRRKRLPLAVAMDTTPLIDIVFQQLIFFMLTSSFVFQPGVKIQLPKTVTTDIAQKENFIVTVAKGDRLYVSSTVVTLQELRTRLVGLAKSKQPLLIRADRQASLGRVVEVWDSCRALGISQVHIATHTNPADNLDETR